MLSFFSIFGIQHNLPIICSTGNIVVNCFHFSVSLGYNTTNAALIMSKNPLWIAFIFQYLWDTTQQDPVFLRGSECCELLSFFSIFGIQHNLSRLYSTSSIVVNCFHFSVSLGYNTTREITHEGETLLWIAFIFQYLWDTTQQ